MPNVTIYTTPSCVYCKMAKEFFKSHNIEYREMNVESDLKAQEEMIKKTGQLGVPVIEINGSIVIGFNKSNIEGLLGING
ncbi:MAG: glutaredoxin domain-containing protein [Candidatus Jorgensenbacteria bacterium]|nr:glutaredoxin domain-containing protein [Candidatus Jorgensenbacteria bacterium]